MLLCIDVFILTISSAVSCEATVSQVHLYLSLVSVRLRPVIQLREHRLHTKLHRAAFI